MKPMHQSPSKEVNTVAEKHFEVRLPEEVLTGFGWQESEVPRRVREALVMELIRLDRIPEAQAAEFLGLNRWELLEVMGRYRVPAIRMSPEELKQELTMEIKQSERV
jgi:hypothetical protein